MKKQALLILSFLLAWSTSFAQVKVSQLPAADTPLTGAELVPITQGGTTKKVTAQQIGNLGGGGSVFDTAGYGLATRSYVNTRVATVSGVNIATTSIKYVKIADSFLHFWRDGAMLEYIPEQDSFIQLGGWTHADTSGSGSVSLKTVFKFNSDLSYGRELAQAPWPAGKHCVAHHYFNDTLYVWGGDAENTSIQDMWGFKVSTSTWYLISNSIISPRANFGEVWFNNQPWLFGGMGYPNPYDTAMMDGAIFQGNRTTGVFTQVGTDTLFKGVLAGCIDSFNNAMYLVGRVNQNVQEEADRAYPTSVYKSTDGITWTYVNDIPVVGRGFPKVIQHGNRLYCLFGYHRFPGLGVVDYDEVISMDTNEVWRIEPSIIPYGLRGRHAAMAASRGDRLYFGEGFLNNSAGYIEEYDAAIINGGTRFGNQIVIGSRDNHGVTVLLNDTAVVSAERDSIVLVGSLVVHERSEPFTTARESYKPLARFVSRSHAGKMEVVLGADSMKTYYNEDGITMTVNGDTYGFNVAKNGEAGFGYLVPLYSMLAANDRTFTLVGNGSYGSVLAVANGSAQIALDVNGDGNVTMPRLGELETGLYDKLVWHTDGGLFRQKSYWTTAGRPASPSAGRMGYNTDSSNYEYWNGSTWGSFGTGSSGGSGGGDTSGNNFKELHFRVGITANAPAAGDSVVTHSALVNKKISVYRAGAYQYDSMLHDGIQYVTGTGSITFHPALSDSEEVVVHIYPITDWSYVYFSPPSSGYEAESDAYFAAVATAGVTLSTPEKEAYDDWVVAEKTASRYSKYTAIYPFMGGTAATHAINAANPGTNNITFSGTWTHNSNGVKGSGGTDYGNTGVVPNGTVTLNSVHMSLYVNQDPAGNGYDIGTTSPSTLSLAYYSNAYTNCHAIGDQATTQSDLLGGNVVTRVASGTYYYVHNSTVNSKSITSADIPNNPIVIGNLGGDLTLGSVRRYGFATIGSGLSSSEAQGLNANTATLQTALGR